MLSNKVYNVQKLFCYSILPSQQSRETHTHFQGDSEKLILIL